MHFQLLVDIMWLHLDQAAVLMAATACMYNLTKNGIELTLHAECLKLIVHSILECMQKHPCTEAVSIYTPLLVFSYLV